MSERDRYIPGVPCWVDATQPDPQAAAEFYGGIFGWELEDSMPAEDAGSYFIARLGGEQVAAISSPMGEAPPQAAWNTYVWVESADETAAKVREAGGTVHVDPFDVMQAGRTAVCADPEGAVFCLWQAGEHRGATLVNEHGSLNFNDLNTRDLDGAKQFYGAVFGWEILTLPGGFPIWSLPGYGEFLDELKPGTLEQMKSMGAPEGFENAVAGIRVLDAGQGEPPPHWSVTFAVDDADAIAAKAKELGGTVLAEPFDAPWVRMTLIADPKGATFTASGFAPENRPGHLDGSPS